MSFLHFLCGLFTGLMPVNSQEPCAWWFVLTSDITQTFWEILCWFCVRSVLVKHSDQLQYIVLFIDREMLEVSVELRMMLYLVLYKAKDSLHTSDSQRMGKKKYNDYLFIAQDLRLLVLSSPRSHRKSVEGLNAWTQIFSPSSVS